MSERDVLFEVGKRLGVREERDETRGKREFGLLFRKRDERDLRGEIRGRRIRRNRVYKNRIL